MHGISKYKARQMCKDFLVKQEKERADGKASNSKIYVDSKYILNEDNHALNHFQLINKINELEEKQEELIEVIKQIGYVLLK